MSSNKKLQNCCKMFRKLEMKIWDNGDCTKMKIPLFGGFILDIKTMLVQQGKKSRIYISDDGYVVKYNKVTLKDIDILCKKYNLECMLNWDEEYTLNCEIYKVVDEKSFCNVVYDIIDLAIEVTRSTKRR